MEGFWALLDDLGRRCRRRLPLPVDPSRYIAAYTSAFSVITSKVSDLGGAVHEVPEQVNVADVYADIRQFLAEVCEDCVRRIPTARSVLFLCAAVAAATPAVHVHVTHSVLVHSPQAACMGQTCVVRVRGQWMCQWAKAVVGSVRVQSS
jgi:hypothetical protein